MKSWRRRFRGGTAGGRKEGNAAGTVSTKDYVGRQQPGREEGIEGTREEEALCREG